MQICNSVNSSSFIMHKTKDFIICHLSALCSVGVQVLQYKMNWYLIVFPDMRRACEIDSLLLALNYLIRFYMSFVWVFLMVGHTHIHIFDSIVVCDDDDFVRNCTALDYFENLCFARTTTYSKYRRRYRGI